ncbi:MAG: aminotransferase class III-fold pyridoxal phosphate-dependent enzyme [Deltaproteobacteria bacterium]|uniref:aminotransferase class III-fold pyridoxal phosphate-dependent enzyme n=1 Tax=Desulfobacula sp. TaxID=2593537 RepID=UPI0019AAB0F9|nr:aminotransferase class III-fold pyridoxal phosphate-dependent enzyme [Candidatus Desulfobacula maris]MBL6993855.1 aminotransferase class III-fold pyridoxal phosphate-dependent enzyme [Desulfobacula sp.]
MKNILGCTGHKLRVPDIVDCYGVYLFDTTGKRYMDLESGIWCTSLGHKNIRINNVIKKQLDSIMHAGFCYSSDLVDNAAKTILSVTGLKNGRCVFLSSGSEAVEILRQAAKHIVKNSKTLVLHDAELGAYDSLSDREHGWYDFEWKNCDKCTDNSVCDLHSKELDKIPEDVTEFIFEPGSDAGLVGFPPKALIQEIVSLIRGNGGKIIANEVTTGIGRTGKWFGYQHYDINPDMIALGKGIGNGYPVSAAVFSESVISELHTFKYSQSHQNDPMGAAVANEVINTIIDDGLIEDAARKGEIFLSQLKTLERSKINIRGRGLMFAIDFMSKKTAEKIYNGLIESGYIVCNRGAFLRIDPPLIITENEFGKFMKTLSSLVDQAIVST